MNAALAWIKKISMIWRSPERVKKSLNHRAREAKKSLLIKLPSVVHAGRRAHCKEVQLDGVRCIKKVFADNDVSKACMTRELVAREIFEDRPWMVPIVDKGETHITFPALPDDRRLDGLAAKLTEAEKQEIALQSVQIAFEIFLEGYAHRDFHSKNMFWVDEQLRVVDYEVLHPYPVGQRPAFPESYDLQGNGLESPFATMNMCYESADPSSLKNVLETPLDTVIERHQDGMRDSLRDASLTFKKRGTRHICRAKKIYNSIDLPFFKVDAAEAQRNCEKRFATLGIQSPDIRGKRVLDLGSNIGGMIFEAERHKPIESVGVEYDAEKVEVARMIAAYNGLNTVRFLQADIDELESDEVGGPFEVVFCFAIEAHVKKKERLFQLLADLTGERLYFEGNSSTNADDARQKLLNAGFRDVQHLGMCDDDYLAENNNRPLLVATK